MAADWRGRSEDGDFERVKAWLAGGSSASDPRSVNGHAMEAGWTLLHWTVVGDQTPERVEFAREHLISQGAGELARHKDLMGRPRCILHVNLSAKPRQPWFLCSSPPGAADGKPRCTRADTPVQLLY